jgi:hypothetical protein
VSRDSREIIRFDKHPSSGSPVTACGQTDRQTDMRNIVKNLSNVAEAPKKATT